MYQYFDYILLPSKNDVFDINKTQKALIYCETQQLPYKLLSKAFILISEGLF